MVMVWRTVVGLSSDAHTLLGGSVSVRECLKSDSCYLPAYSGEIKINGRLVLFPRKAVLKNGINFLLLFLL